MADEARPRYRFSGERRDHIQFLIGLAQTGNEINQKIAIDYAAYLGCGIE